MVPFVLIGSTAMSLQSKRFRFPHFMQKASSLSAILTALNFCAANLLANGAADQLIVKKRR
jgi:hypothetical protein